MLLFILLAALPYAASLLGYDCGGDGLNITTISLLDIGDCSMQDIEPSKEETHIQLMQLTDYDTTAVTQCKIEVDRTINYCGMHSHVSAVHNGRREYLLEIGEQACRRLHDIGTISIGNAVLDRIVKNTTNLRSAMLAGTVSVDGRCAGSQYSDGYGSWENVIVQASIRITLRAFTASVKRSTGKVLLPTGTHCDLTPNYCIDADGAENYWNSLPVDSCHFDRYDILYQGLATKLTPKGEQTTPVIYTVTTQETTFALAKASELSLCGYKLIQTEHPKLFILETQEGRTFKTKTKISVDNLDIFSYVNSKFIYVEKHIRTQLTQLYRDIMEQKCALEQQILRNALSLASVAPDEMAFRIMKGPGYTAVTTGEVIHLIRCVPVECKIRQTKECYHELPVAHRNTSLFLLPRSRILARNGTPRECSGLLPVMYKIQGTWFRMTPNPMETIAPPTIQPLTHPAWHYINPTSLAASGIYSSEDLDRLRTHIMFPVERPSMVNNIVRGAMGESVPSGSISMLNLLDEDSLNKIAETAGERVWQGFITFGSASAGVLAIILIVRIAKLIIDTIIHGYALHAAYGWSLHLLAAVWSSVTNLLLHNEHRSKREPSTIEEAKEKEEMIQTQPANSNHNNGSDHTTTDRPQYSYSDLRRYLKDPSPCVNQAKNAGV